MAGIGSRLCIYRDPAVSIYCQKKDEKFSCTIDAGRVVLESVQFENTLYTLAS